MNSHRLCCLLIAMVMAGAARSTSLAADINIAAAADLQFAFDELVAEFHASQPGHRVKVTYGSSGNFYAQVQNQAPFDLYFSAEVRYPRQLAEAGLALDDVFLYAVGRLVIWVPTRSPIDVKLLGLHSLFAPSVRKIAIANPQHAPYGVAAVAALKSLGVYERAAPKLVHGENVAQTAQFVQSGAADIGIIALALAIAPQLSAQGKYWDVPLEAYPTMEQGGMILRATKQPALARRFRDFVLGAPGRDVLRRYGFVLPQEAAR